MKKKDEFKFPVEGETQDEIEPSVNKFIKILKILFTCKTKKQNLA